MNRTQLTGRLTSDPTLHSTANGTSVCSLRIAVENMARGETGFIDVAVFGNPGEAAARVLSKGWLVAVDGRLDQHSWETDEGQKRSAISVIGNVEFLAAPRSATAEQERAAA